VIVLAVGAFLALGSIYDLISAARNQLPSDHASTFTVLTGTSWQDAGAMAYPTTPYIRILEIDYAIYEILFAALFLVVAAIPLRRGERWAWWCSWLIVFPLLTFAVLFGTHDSANFACCQHHCGRRRLSTSRSASRRRGRRPIPHARVSSMIADLPHEQAKR
jgi:hypothetical protein